MTDFSSVEQTSLSECSDHDLDVMARQLDRPMRGVVGIAARCICSTPQVVATAPRLEDGTPFPTTFYLTHPALVRAASRLEAAHKMVDYQNLLADDDDLAAAYRAAHDLYRRQRDQIGALAGLDPVEEIAHVSAGGMPSRVKCLHALIGHALACGPGINPIGDMALRDMGWSPTQCWCDRD